MDSRSRPNIRTPPDHTEDSSSQVENDDADNLPPARSEASGSEIRLPNIPHKPKNKKKVVSIAVKAKRAALQDEKAKNIQSKKLAKAAYDAKKEEEGKQTAVEVNEEVAVGIGGAIVDSTSISHSMAIQEKQQPK